MPITEEVYRKIIDDSRRFRGEWLDPAFAESPERFPPGGENGYEMKGRYHSKRLDIDIRRIVLRNGRQYQIRPAFALPGDAFWMLRFRRRCRAMICKHFFIFTTKNTKGAKNIIKKILL